MFTSRLFQDPDLILEKTISQILQGLNYLYISYSDDDITKTAFSESNKNVK